MYVELFFYFFFDNLTYFLIINLTVCEKILLPNLLIKKKNLGLKIESYNFKTSHILF